MARVRLDGLSRELSVSVAGLTGPEAVRAFAAFSRRERDKVVAAKRARSGSDPGYATVVNGQVGASEDTVRLPGPIVYVFDSGNEISGYLIDFLKARSPKDTGRYISRFRFIQNGRYVSAHQINPDLEFYALNVEPYSRKIDVGAMKGMSVPPHVFEDAAQAARRRFGNVASFSVKYLDLADGYILKGKGKKRRGKSREGERMRYPAVLVSPR